MNLGELAEFVTQKVGQTDDNSVVICRNFINSRYAMIYDAFPWADSEMTATVGLRAAEDKFEFPVRMQRVIAVRAGTDTFLDPITTNELLQTDPTIFDRSGNPTSYQDLVDDDGIRKIQVFPRPDKPVDLFVVGKRSRVDLVEEGDEPILRNIDQVLMAYVEGDMLERQNRRAASQPKFTEAAALLTSIQQLETQQSNKPRQIKQLTVAGNSLSELTDAVCARTDKWSLSDRAFIKDCLRRGYQRLYDSNLWPESTVVARVTNDGGEIILPVYFDRVISVRGNSSFNELSANEPSQYFAVDPTLFEQTGIATTFSYLTSVGVKFLPPTQEKLLFSSTSTSDSSDVRVMGEFNGSEVQETISLDGTKPVQTHYNYDTPITVAKDTTEGNVSVYGATSGALLETIPFNQRECKHIRIWVQPVPSATECLILGKRKINPLVTDQDTPIIRNCQHALIASAAMEVLLKAGSLTAQAMQQQADKAMADLVGLEITQAAFSATVVPYTEGYGSRNSDGWLRTARGGF